MFSTYHFAWLGICAVLIALSACYLYRRRPPLTQVLSLACMISILSELVKTISMMQLVPNSEGNQLHLYLQMQHLPLHLCSLQIFFIFYARFAAPGKKRTTLLAFMYPTCLIGAASALLMPSIFSTSIELNQAFSHPLAYQFFLFHTMLVILGFYIPLSRQVAIRARHYWSTLALLAILAFASLYLNAIFADPVYLNGSLQSVEYTPNFFFTYRTPIGIRFTALWQWYLYLGILLLLALVLIGLFYWPYYRAERRQRRQQEQAQ